MLPTNPVKFLDFEIFLPDPTDQFTCFILMQLEFFHKTFNNGPEMIERMDNFNLRISVRFRDELLTMMKDYSRNRRYDPIQGWVAK